MKVFLSGLLVCFFIVWIGVNTSSSGELYRWVDENGVVHYSDSLNDEAIARHKAVQPRVIQNPEKEQEEFEKEKQEAEARKAQAQKENAEIIKEYEKGAQKTEDKKVVATTGDTVLTRKEYEQTLQQTLERNAKIREQNAQIIKENERLQEEYEKKLKEIEARNAEIDARNEKIRKENEQAQKEYEQKLKELEAQQGLSGVTTAQTQKE